MGKYDAWDAFFGELDGDEQRFTFDELESLTKVDLPPSARQHLAWWWGLHIRPLWEKHGWKASPRIAEGTVIFRRRPGGSVPIPETAREPAVLDIEADAVLVGCVATKRNSAMAAKDLYTSALWDRRRAYAEASRKPWAILSAEYGLVQPDEVIEPYDRYLGDQSKEYRQQWSESTAAAIAGWCRKNDASAVEIHAGKAYVDHGLESELQNHGISVSRPLAHHRQGEQLAWYDDRMNPVGSDAAKQQAEPEVVVPRSDAPVHNAEEPRRPVSPPERPVLRTRESRIERARQMAEATSAERAVERESVARERATHIASLGRSRASIEAKKLTEDESIGYLGPLATPHEWKVALQAAREVVIESARRRETLTYAELQIAAVRASGQQIGYSMYGTFCMELNHPGQDGCLISSIVVGSDTGEPGPGLLPFAESIGFDKPLDELQEDVYQRFGLGGVEEPE